MWNYLLSVLNPETRSSVDMLSRAVAERSLDEIRSQLSPAVCHMSLAEARGYIGARAVRVVRRHTQIVAAEQGGLTARLQTTICTRALDRAVHRTIRELLCEPRAQFGLPEAA